MEKKKAGKIDRRTYLKMTGTAAGVFALGLLAKDFVRPSSASVQVPQVPLLGRAIQKYVSPLPHFAGVRVTGNNLTVSMEEFQEKVLPDAFYAALLPPYNAGTYVWGYKIASFGPLYPGFTVEATRGVLNTMTYVNNLPNPPFLQQYLTVDQTLHWADPLLLGHAPMGTTCPIGILDPNAPDHCQPYMGPPPLVTHLHGGEVPSDFDGGPEQWFTPNGLKGLAYRTKSPTSTNAAVYEYLNRQEPATLWFHDHVLGITRLNVYAGLAVFYFLRDWTLERPNLPGGPDDTTVIDNSDPINPKTIKPEIEIAIQDRMFDTNGQWLFPDLGLNPEHPFWIPEFLGDTIVVNGRTWPFLNVEPRRYRFRFLDGSNARFYSMRLKDVTNPANPLPGPPIWQIGTDGGLLDTPAQIAYPKELLIAPGERADVIIDFKMFAGKTLILYNSARAPYPKGAPPDPNTTGQIIQFRVGTTLSNPMGPTGDPSYDPSTLQSPRLAAMNRLVDPLTGKLAANVTPVQYRQLTLNEVMGPGGPLEVLLNNTKWNGQDPMMNPIPGSVPDSRGNYLTELPQNNTTEVWEIINLTADAHPIHLHLVQFQLLNRQSFQTNKYLKAYAAAFPGGGLDPMTGLSYPAGVYMPAYGPPMLYSTNQTPGTTVPTIGGNPDVTPFLQGKLMPPAPNEAGWKDTVIMYPGQVTRIAVRFKAQDGTGFLFDPTGSTKYAYDSSGNLAEGPGYVWHCHIIDHEDNEMMRPYKVALPPP